MKRVLKAIDLFAGIGGIRLGFEKAGFEIVYSNEIDKYCCETYRTNFGEIDERDIREVKSEEIPDFDVLLAGFPCQPFSMAGIKKGFEDPRGNLFFQIERILRDKRPAAFMLENVKFLKSHRRGATFTVIKDVLENQLGYHIAYEVLNSKDFGLPQNRERIYIVGFKENVKFKFPEPTEEKLKIRNILEKSVDEKYFISQRYYECLVRHKENQQKKGNGFGFKVLDVNSIANALTVGRMGLERNLIKATIPPKLLYREGLDKSLRNKEGLRILTPRECAWLQGFPNSFTFPVSNTQIYRQLGNTVSVPVIKAIARKIKTRLWNMKHGAVSQRATSSLEHNRDFLYV